MNHTWANFIKDCIYHWALVRVKKNLITSGKAYLRLGEILGGFGQKMFKPAGNTIKLEPCYSIR